VTDEAKARQIREAAERVRRLSTPGTPERFLTLCAVAEETGLRVTQIGDMLVTLSRRPRKVKRDADPTV
jgi:hypothetical protein